jgi:hypothetical protein
MTQDFLIKKLGHEFSTQMSCQEAGCVAYAEGWLTVLDVVGDDQHAGIANWIKRFSGRRFFEWAGDRALEEAYSQQARGVLTVTPALKACLEGLTAGMVCFYFWPGQTCFRLHLDREVKFLHRTRERVREHVKPIEWTEHNNEELYKLRRAVERG